MFRAAQTGYAATARQAHRIGHNIIVSGGSTLTFFDDVINNGSEIRVSAGRPAVYFGAVSGIGRFTGTGLKFFEGTFNPSNSSALEVLQGDIGFGANNALTIELAGLAAGTEDDQIEIGQQVALGRKLHINLLSGSLPTVDDALTYLIAGGGNVAAPDVEVEQDRDLLRSRQQLI